MCLHILCGRTCVCCSSFNVQANSLDPQCVIAHVTLYPSVSVSWVWASHLVYAEFQQTHKSYCLNITAARMFTAVLLAGVLFTCPVCYHTELYPQLHEGHAKLSL